MGNILNSNKHMSFEVVGDSSDKTSRRMKNIELYRQKRMKDKNKRAGEENKDSIQWKVAGGKRTLKKKTHKRKNNKRRKQVSKKHNKSTRKQTRKHKSKKN